ncbi:MAG: c-type cytochrome biogenesis protein CcmI [Sideroxydans sp.]|nr:c-type cytochrome biogenesis protein CcmI [Sideroxydans sp.]
MMLFWILSALLLLLAVSFVVVPLWRNKVTSNAVLRDAANLEILRDQSAEMSADLAHGLLNQESFEQGQRELQARLLDEVKSTAVVNSVVSNPAKKLAVAMTLLIPIASVLLYLQLGSTKALLPPPDEVSAVQGFGVLRSDVALEALAKKLAESPNNPDGWVQLGRSYSELKRYSEASQAYEQLVKLVANEAQVWTEYADVYAMAHGQTLLGEPTKFLDKALALDEKNTTALALSGSAAMERGDYVAAITHWQKLVSLLPADYQDIQMIQDGVKQAREFLAMQKGGKEKLAQLNRGTANPTAASHAAEAITGKVSLSAAMQKLVSPDDIVFILARAAEGPKMPLAVLRKQVKDLPLEFSLDDSMAMQPQLKLSGFAQVVVVARISKSGTPMAQPGDVQGLSATIKPGTKGLNIVIDSVVK